MQIKEGITYEVITVEETLAILRVSNLVEELVTAEEIVVEISQILND